MSQPSWVRSLAAAFHQAGLHSEDSRVLQEVAERLSVGTEHPPAAEWEALMREFEEEGSPAGLGRRLKRMAEQLTRAAELETAVATERLPADTRFPGPKRLLLRLLRLATREQRSLNRELLEALRSANSLLRGLTALSERRSAALEARVAELEKKLADMEAGPRRRAAGE